MRTILLLFITFTSIAQNNFVGRVTDSGGEPIVGANILIEESNLITYTDEKGKFYLNSNSTNIEILVSHVGYLTKEIKFSNPNQEINIVLDDGIILKDEIKVISTRAKYNSPFAFTNISKSFIEKNNSGKDIPFLINSTPSTYSTSDAGNGIGYTGVRIRGSDATRINVTINGIPYNDSESHGVFWVNVSDLASSANSIQIQRGVGSSTNGGGAFGGTVSIKTGKASEDFKLKYSSSAGSYKSFKNTLELNSGLIKNKINMNLRLSKINSDGYVDRATSDLKSYYASASYYSDKTSIDLINFSGKERTYQSWWGTPEGRINNDIEEMNNVIANNGYSDEQADNLLNSGRTFNYYTYDNQTDNYQQDHYQMHFNHDISNTANLHLALHYTYGRGYYEEFREDDNLSNYYDFLENKSLDLVRRRWLSNHFYGLTYSFSKKFDKSEINIGGALNEYDADHFGEIIQPQLMVSEPYYFSKSFKKDGNIFIKYNLNITESAELFTDMQLRGYSHKMKGNDNDKSIIDVDKNNVFFNPKIGLTKSLNDKVILYGSVAVANREPIRSDYIDSKIEPKHESLVNIELGKGFNYNIGSFNTNLYLMEYNNQLITTGEVNDVGAYIRENVKKSRRFGVEFTNVLNSKDFYVNSSLSLSRNLVYNFNETLYDYGADFSQYNIIENKYVITDLAFSPGVLLNNHFEWKANKFLSFILNSKYVGKQYLDNTSNEKRVLKDFLINDFKIQTNLTNNVFNNLFFKIEINNIFNVKYSSNGYTFGYYGGMDYEVRENYFYPQATRNIMFSVSIEI
ncbi:MAG: TonB-dependent receptor [Flammeovirgaceae bacterium]|nr:TonB-dependent receptor [Flammeovirgaceae bacterium]